MGIKALSLLIARRGLETKLLAVTNDRISTRILPFPSLST